MRKQFFCGLRPWGTIAISRGQAVSTSSNQTTAPNQSASAPAPSMVSIYEVPPITAGNGAASPTTAGCLIDALLTKNSQ